MSSSEVYWSRCSRSIVVTTATTGASMRKLRSLSSASTTKYSPLPSRAVVPIWLTFPPITNVGSRCAAASTEATIEVVVVLPCAPATAIPYFNRISSANISARSEEHTSELQSQSNLVCRLLLEKKNNIYASLPGGLQSGSARECTSPSRHGHLIVC